MAEVIQFNCPVCGTLLRLPLAMASERGPCPNCQREIMAPDPARGIGAFEISMPPQPREIEPFRPFAESPRVVPIPESAPIQVAPVEIARKPQWAALVLSCLLTGAVALALGFALGVRSTGFFMRVPPMASLVKEAKPAPPAEVKAPEPEPVPLRVKPMIEIPPVGNKPEPTQVSAAAEAALRAFLEAPDWASRSTHVLFPEIVRSAMEAYSHEVPDGPTPFTSLAVKQTQVDAESGSTLFIFFVSTDAFPTGIPVAVQETPGGWLVDWRAFVEFRDQLFQKFADGPAGKTGRFHLIVSPPSPERAENTTNEHFVSFLLNAPLNKTPQIAFVKRSSEVFATFQATTAAGGFFTPVLEVAKRKTADGKSYLEVLRVIATDWKPRKN